METNRPNNAQSMSWWIISLAISVVCCAILFVVFAGYLVTVKENMAVSKVKFEVLEQRLAVVTSDMDYLRRRSTVQQIQIIPANGQAATPETVVPAVIGAQNPAAASTSAQPQPTVQNPVAAPEVMTPNASVPTEVVPPAPAAQ